MSVNSSVSAALMERAASRCELCGDTTALEAQAVPPQEDSDAGHCVLLCQTCRAHLQSFQPPESAHWHCLKDCAWSDVGAVKVLTWQLLKCLEDQTWAAELLEQMYLEDHLQDWASAGLKQYQTTATEDSAEIPTVDSNGAVLKNGDSVCIVKDLNVKGTTFTAKRGTIVRNIRLTNNPEHVEGRVNNTVIVLKTCFLKKSG